MLSWPAIELIGDNNGKDPSSDVTVSYAIPVTPVFANFILSSLFPAKCRYVNKILSLVINLNYCILANTYYVSNSIGNDDYDGLSIEHPFKSIEKINSLYFYPGDTILFKSGDLWKGMLWIKGSGSVQNPIIVDSYGDEIKPVINGNGYQACIFLENVEFPYC